MPARTAAGSVGQASITAARSGDSCAKSAKQRAKTSGGVSATSCVSWGLWQSSGSLENCCTGNRSGGSNPSPSALKCCVLSYSVPVEKGNRRPEKDLGPAPSPQGVVETERDRSRLSGNTSRYIRRYIHRQQHGPASRQWASEILVRRQTFPRRNALESVPPGQGHAGLPYPRP